MLPHKLAAVNVNGGHVNDTPKVAYKTSDPAIVGAWKATADAIREAGKLAADAAEQIGKNKGLMIQRSMDEERFVGLAPIDPSDPPEGWRYVRSQFEPRRGKAGDAARAWLKSIQRPNMREVLAEHGLPKLTTMKYGFFGVPGLVLHNNTIYAIYKGGPSNEPGPAWELCRASEFYAAEEDADAAAEAVAK